MANRELPQKYPHTRQLPHSDGAADLSKYIYPANRFPAKIGPEQRTDSIEGRRSIFRNDKKRAAEA